MNIQFDTSPFTLIGVGILVVSAAVVLYSGYKSKESNILWHAWILAVLIIFSAFCMSLHPQTGNLSLILMALVSVALGYIGQPGNIVINFFRVSAILYIGWATFFLLRETVVPYGLSGLSALSVAGLAVYSTIQFATIDSPQGIKDRNKISFCAILFAIAAVFIAYVATTPEMPFRGIWLSLDRGFDLLDKL